MHTKIPIILMNLPELINDHYKKDCTVPCKWCMHGQPCMILSKCKGVSFHNGIRSREHTDGDGLVFFIHKED